MNAETRQRRARLTRRVPAASMGPRSLTAETASGVTTSIDASMGPRSLTAETLTGGECAGSASMGPRSDERGNASATPGLMAAIAGKTQLQWGRVLMNAETRKPTALDVLLT